MTRYYLEWIVELKRKYDGIEFFGQDDKAKIAIGDNLVISRGVRANNKGIVLVGDDAALLVLEVFCVGVGIGVGVDIGVGAGVSIGVGAGAGAGGSVSVGVDVGAGVGACVGVDVCVGVCTRICQRFGAIHENYVVMMEYGPDCLKW